VHFSESLLLVAQHRGDGQWGKADGVLVPVVFAKGCCVESTKKSHLTKVTTHRDNEIKMKDVSKPLKLRGG
jgi:hypothetical protein